MAGQGKDKNFAAKMLDNIRTGDRMIWMIVVMLMMVSLVAIFSSTSTLAIKLGLSRTVIFLQQLGFVIGGLVLLVLLSAVPNIKYIRVLSQYGFIVSVILLLMIVNPSFHIGNLIKADTRNDATRALFVFGFTVQVYEVVKVAMVMYLSWAMHSFEKNSFVIGNRLGTAFPQAFGWMKSDRGQKWTYLYIPMLTVMGLAFPGSTGSAMILGGIMGATLLIGGLKWKDIIGVVAMLIATVSLIASVHIVSNGKIFGRFETACNRLGIELPYPDKEVRQKQLEKIAAKKVGSKEISEMNGAEYAKYTDHTMQNNSAEVAFVQGGRLIVGKGPGKSTQKYKVPLIFEDYMFSLLMEEYGIIGALVVFILYISLFARGVIIVNNCSGRFAKTCVGGLVFLITAQAMIHIIVNCNIGIVTGQTLPMISHGKSSLLCFTVAFGVILSISKMANGRIEKEQRAEAEKLTSDDNQQGINDIEELNDLIDNLK